MFTRAYIPPPPPHYFIRSTFYYLTIIGKNHTVNYRNADLIENTPHFLVVHQLDEEALIRHNLVVDHYTERRYTGRRKKTNLP